MKNLFYDNQPTSPSRMDVPCSAKKLNDLQMKTKGFNFRTTIKTSFLLVSLGLSLALSAKENIPGTGGAGHRNANSGNNSVMGGCVAGTTQQEILLNNVRTRILTDGDMWWDFAASVAKYEIPKGSNSYAMFAGSLWFGGYASPTDLRVAAMTYRQNGVDFWPGPLNPVDLSIDVPTCQAYDKVWQFNKTDVLNFYSYWQQYNTADPATPTWIKDYPGNSLYPGNPVSVPIPTYHYDQSATLQGGATAALNYLAPYFDANGDGTYNYANGDYPAYIVSANTKPARGHCVRYLFGDVTNFWVFNDNANKHTETKSLNNIGVEVRGQAFEFSTNDELNDMTFYNFEIINWSTNTLTQSYFTVWADCDLGDYQDDYVGCDVGRGLGYQYNGDNYDEDVGGQTGYHDKLPAIGCDFFQGPYADVGDGVDNDRDGCVDCSWSPCVTGANVGQNLCPPAILDNALPEQCIMSRFTYYNNSGASLNGNPNGYAAYYNLMIGNWETGAAMTYGTQGLNATSGANPACKFLYPGTSDPLGWGLGYHPLNSGAASTQGTPIPPPPTWPNWTEASVPNNPPGDRRFMQSAGPFTLLPGAVNYVTYGLPFARSNSNNNLEPIPLMEAADDKAQSLFDNCFKVLDGPDAPDLTIQELNQQFLITLTNNPYTSNNYEAKRYADLDPSIQLPTQATGDRIYRFEGYKVYQVLDGTVSVSDLYNTNLARLIFQCDIKNGVGQLINYNTDPTLGTVPQLMVSGADLGIQNSFSVTQDQFAVSNKTLVNFKNYYFIAVAYAYNNYLTYLPDVAPTGVATPTTVVTSTPTGTVLTNTVIVVSNNPATGDSKGQKKPYLQGRNNVKSYTAIPHDPGPESYGTVMNSVYGSGPDITRIEGQGNGGYALDLTDASVADILNPANNSRAQQITYIGGRTPLLVKVIDPLRVVKGDFTVKFVSAIAQPSGYSTTWYYNGNSPIAGPTLLDTGRIKNTSNLKWFMTGTYTDLSGNKATKTWLSDEGLSVAQEKIITGINNESLGFSVTIRQTSDPQKTCKVDTLLHYSGATLAGDLLESSIQFSGSSWLGGVQDIDGTAQDWILAGSNIAGYPASPGIPAIPGDINASFAIGTNAARDIVADPSSVWESVVGGTWAPFRMINPNAPYPGLTNTTANSGAQINNSAGWGDTRLLSSVDVVLTKDQSKWTRCPVIDMNPGIDPTTNLPYRWQLRNAPSVDKNGTTATGPDNNDYPTGMGWFPGYAINLETGERLNVIFSENSADPTNNGNDMLWNPTGAITATSGTVSTIVNGGMHYIYVLGHNADGNFTIGSDVIPADARRYDGGKSTYQMLKCPASWGSFTSYTANQKINKWAFLAELFKDIMWTSMPLSSVDIKDPRNIPNDAKVKIRVIKPFRYGLSTVTSPANTSYSLSATGSLFSPTVKTFSLTPLNSNLLANAPSDVVSNPQNGNFPMYSFNTNNLVASTYQQGTAQSELARINIVPNPYYAHDSYEQTRIDLQVKIINLPVQCTIKIYTLTGTLIRTLTKDNNDTYMVWDLHNSANIQIASGLYVLHIDAPGVGEKIIKWFGVMRPYDLQSY
jgi:hypothetical protein